MLGYPGEISKALDADHHGVCKYENPNDPNYVTVRNVLKSLITKVSSSKESKLTSSLEQEELAIVENILAVTESPDEDYIFFRDRWAPGTCGWILEHSTYLQWLHGSEKNSRLLWLQGGIASGKSVLSSFIVDDLAQRGISCQYFFVRFGDYGKRSLNVILRSLAFQIAHAVPTFRRNIIKLSGSITRFKDADAQTI